MYQCGKKIHGCYTQHPLELSKMKNAVCKTEIHFIELTSVYMMQEKRFVNVEAQQQKVSKMKQKEEHDSKQINRAPRSCKTLGGLI